MLIALEIFIYIFCSFTASCCAVLGFFLRYKFTKHLKNMRKALFLLFLFASVQLVTAQTDGARAFSSGGGMAGNVSYSFGLPFFSQPEADGMSVSEGVMHAQLVRLDIELADCQNAELVSPAKVKDSTKFFMGYDGEEMVFNGETILVFPAGHYDSTSLADAHYNWDAEFNYDSITTLVLDVWPIYEIFDTLYVDSADLAGYAQRELNLPSDAAALHGGPNKYDLVTVEHNCDSICHFFVNLCGGIVKDAEGNEYPSLFVGDPRPYCWTAINMRNTHTNAGEEVEGLVYQSPEFPNEQENLDTYGHLYTWYAAVGLPNGSDAEPARTVNGNFVTGICPPGWHIPDSANVVSLASVDALGLMSTNLWLKPGTNTTGFTALPAGIYESNIDRFENLLGQTSYWSTVKVNTTAAKVCSLYYGCQITVLEDMLIDKGLSVRCVKNQMFDEEGNELND